MPLRSQIHVDQLLSNVSVRYKPNGLAASEVFPFVPVKKDSDLYRIYTQNFRIPETKRANKGLANEHQMEVTTAAYSLEKHALKDYVGDDEAANYDLTDLRTDVTEELTEKIYLRMEKSVADLMTTTAWSLNVSLATAALWTADTTVSNPIPVMDTAATTVLNNGGMAPNCAVMPRAVYVAAKNHQSVLDRVKHTSKDMTPEILSALFGLEKLYVPTASQDTAHQGVASSISSLWGNHVLSYYKPASPGPKQPSAGYIFKMSTPEVRRWRVEERKAEAVEVEIQYQAKPVSTLSAYLIKGAI